MLTAAARSSLRHGSKVSRLWMLSAARQTPTTLTGGLALPHDPSGRALSPAPSWCFSAGHAARFVSLSASSREDTFGSLSKDLTSRSSFKKSSPDIRDLRHQDEEEEADDLDKPRRRPGRRNTPYWYFLQCKKLIRENKLQEALDVFSREMLQEERLQPEEYNYSVLIGGCGRAGQLKKAFKLYNDMKKRDLEASDATYTALFNACAESPSKQAGLQQALKLEQELRRKSYPLSTITYHALLKTHAVTNHLQACIHTLREMLQNGHAVTQETFHYLLMGCLKDKETGFRLALQVWRQMLRSGIVPDSKNYNMLLRTARDCGIGDSAIATNILLSPESNSWRDTKDASEERCRAVVDLDLLEKQLFFQQEPHSNDHQQDNSEGTESTHLVPVRQTETVPLPTADSVTPSLLNLFDGHQGSVLSLNTADVTSDRLALIGGAKGILEKMEASGLSPDLRTLTLLADLVEPGYQSLQLLLRAAKQHRVKLDVAFFNSAIRKAAKTSNIDEAKAVLSVMKQRNVNVNIQTFGCLALACSRKEDGLQLLRDIQDAGLRPNVHVFSALIGRASRRLDYIYLKVLLKSMEEMSVWPNEVIIKQLEFAAQYPPNYNQYGARNNYLVHIDGFRGYYQLWLRKMPAQSAEEEQLQSEMGGVELTTEDGLTEAQRNQRAAARRFKARHSIRTVA
uniref:Pentatricopeptide repeat domain 1 n=1 Tax=Nothobranchius rachovii TaxID=451742 RepID=A0A1A8NMH9_9TELE